MSLTFEKERENMLAGKNVIDFTQDSIIKNLTLFSLPIVMGELLQTLYNSVDALVVGNFVSDIALYIDSLLE